MRHIYELYVAHDLSALDPGSHTFSVEAKNPKQWGSEQRSLRTSGTISSNNANVLIAGAETPRIRRSSPHLRLR